MEKKQSIIIVEDSFIVALHLRSALESEGYNIIDNFDTAEQLLHFLEINNSIPDLVLMDVMLAGNLDGIDAAEVVKSKYGIPVIFITALSDKETINRAKVTEPYGYLTKPFEDREIITVIEMALYKHAIESKLRKSEELYENTLNSISDAVIVLDIHLHVRFANPAAQILLEVPSNLLTKQSIFNVFKIASEKNSSEFINPIQCELTLPRKSSMPNQIYLRQNSGRYIPVGDSSISPITDERGKCTGLVLIFRDITDKREHEQLLRNIEKQKTAALIEGQETERSRIAKDLHDGLGQMLSAIKMNVQRVLKHDDSSVNLLNQIDDAIQESIRISENLLPAKLKDFDINTCLRSLCKSVGNSYNVLIDFDDTDVITNISQHQKVNLYRITQEAINNVLKHAQAKRITVQLQLHESMIKLTVEDDGIGMQQIHENDFYKHKGLVNIRDRTEILGGKLLLESKPGEGTLLIVDIPHLKTPIYENT